MGFCDGAVVVDGTEDGERKMVEVGGRKTMEEGIGRKKEKPR